MSLEMYMKNKIRVQESQTIEFKQIWRDEYLRTICAFANTDGGVLYLGIDDDSNIVGVDIMFNDKFLILNEKRGALNIIDQCLEHSLPKPTFEYEWTAVRTTFYKATVQAEAQAQAQADLTDTERKVLKYLKNENLSSAELVQRLGLKSLSGGLKSAIKHLLEIQLIELTIPDKPKSPNQKYKTKKGI